MKDFTMVGGASWDLDLHRKDIKMGLQGGLVQT